MKISILEIAIPSLVTIVGFFISYMKLKKEKNLDTVVHKSEEQLKILIDLPREILLYINDYMALMANKNIDEKRFEEAQKRIFDDLLCYGSEDAIKILMYFEDILVRGIDDNVSLQAVQIITPLVLLLMQTKYDITNVKTSPKVWYVNFTSQKMSETGFYEKSVVETNKIVNLLRLNDFLQITDSGLY